MFGDEQGVHEKRLKREKKSCFIFFERESFGLKIKNKNNKKLKINENQMKKLQNYKIKIIDNKGIFK